MIEPVTIGRVWVFAGRLQIQRGRLAETSDASGMVAFAWFVWEHGHEGPPALGWISPDREGNPNFHTTKQMGAKQ